SLQAAREKFGRINGVVHAAGMPGGGAIQLKSPEGVLAVLRAKVQGTQVLATLFKAQPPDFLVFCSSVNAVVGGFGQVDYCAASAFLDAYAHAESGTGITTLSINWDMWSDVGMALDTKVPKHLQEQRALDLKHGMTAGEGQAVFARVLTSGLSQ